MFQKNQFGGPAVNLREFLLSEGDCPVTISWGLSHECVAGSRRRWPKQQVAATAVGIIAHRRKRRKRRWGARGDKEEVVAVTWRKRRRWQSSVVGRCSVRHVGREELRCLGSSVSRCGGRCVVSLWVHAFAATKAADGPIGEAGTTTSWLRGSLMPWQVQYWRWAERLNEFSWKIRKTGSDREEKIGKLLRGSENLQYQ